MTRFFSLALVAYCLSNAAAAQELSAADQVVPVWPAAPPTWNAPSEQERDTSGPDGRDVAGKPVIRLGFVSKPELHIYRPKQNDSGTAVLVCPGGGYSILAWDLEGTEIAQWLQGLGVTAVVVKYRVPSRGADAPWLPPVQDIQRSVSLLRSGAITGLKPQRIGVLGFSAGGNASARVALASKRHYDPIDDSDQASPQPDFAVLVYPAWLVTDDNPKQLIDELQVTEKSPPMFFAHAADDRISAMSSVTLFAELQQRKIPSSLHVFASGGHGFGGRIDHKPTDAWRDLCSKWMNSQGWLSQ